MNQMNSKSCLIRSVNVSQRNSIILNWAKTGNWDMAVDDATCFFKIDLEVSFIAYRGVRPIISMVNYSDSYSFGDNLIPKGRLDKVKAIASLESG